MKIPIEDVYGKLQTLNRSTCSCDKCKDMCRKRVCWGTPAEIEKIIEAGHAKLLMADYWLGGFNHRGDTVYIICPASRGNAGRVTSFNPLGECVCQDSDGKCLIHNIKPIEAWAQDGCKENTKEYPGFNVHEYIARTWDTREGRKLVKSWCKLVGCDI